MKNLDKIVENMDIDGKVFLLSVDQEICAGWADYLRPHLPKQAEIFYAIIGEDHFAGPNGGELSLSSYLQKLSQANSSNTDREKDREAACQHIPGKPVYESVSEPPI